MDEGALQHTSLDEIATALDCLYQDMLDSRQLLWTKL